MSLLFNFIYAFFVLCRNLDWLYSTPAGRQQIIANAKYTTVAFIYLQSDEEYRDLEQVKLEMTSAVLDFKPVNLSDSLQVEKQKLVFTELNRKIIFLLDSFLIIIGRHWASHSS